MLKLKQLESWRKHFLQLPAIFIIFAIVVLVPHAVYSGSFTNFIKKQCPREFNLHQETVAEFAVRMKPFVKDCGCGVVNLYYALSRNNMELIEQLEEDMDMMCAAAEVFEISDEFTNALRNSSDSVATLVLLARNDPEIFKKLSRALSSFSKHDSRQLRRNSSYILYYLLASAMVDKDTQSNNIEFIVKNLKKKVSVGSISALAMLYWQSIIVYPNANPDYWMRAAEETLKSLGPKTVKTLGPYKDYLAYFLPPTEDDIPESQNISALEIQELRQDYMGLIVYIFQEITRIYGTPYALRVVEYIFPSVLEALRFHHNKREIKAYLSYEFNANSFSHVLQNGVCQSESGDQGLKSFFIMYSPYDNGYPVPGTEGNLGLIAKWFAEGHLRQYIDEAKDINGYIYSMSLLPKIYLRLSQNQKIVFNDLLFSLSENPTLNARVIIALNNTTVFFNWIENSPDAFLNINHNPDARFGKSAKKYKYILLTSYPKDDSLSIFYKFDGISISSNDLNHMMSMSISELESHNFTPTERYMHTAEKIFDITDGIVTFGSIAAIPLTTGASASVTVMMLARKGATTAAKRAIKTLAKKSLKSTMKLVGRKGWKVAGREAKEVLGVAAKRGRKAVREEAIKKGIYTTDEWVSSISLGAGVTAVALTYFLANGPDSSQPADLCDEIRNLAKGD